MAEKKTINVKVFRFDPEKDKDPRYVTYEIEYEEGMSLLNVFQYIYENIDSSLAFYYSCRIGSCGGCGIMMDGKAVLSCCTRARDGMIIEPPTQLGFKVAKDLICIDYMFKDRDILSLGRLSAHQRFNRAYKREEE
jgi:succinate dehydrogenase/fumarate reductase-like Fe-S protein